MHLRALTAGERTAMSTASLPVSVPGLPHVAREVSPMTGYANMRCHHIAFLLIPSLLSLPAMAASPFAQNTCIPCANGFTAPLPFNFTVGGPDLNNQVFDL